ncbi:hypothetical protein O9H85_16815 [Paenibacillus filicis]|uniref:Uncharacterized protein n=1 Tax=Paenibacillus gyeongsangnamensis TaxID=3388067 RepID=A0ABT4QB50_9BACL|nr:hypothetical protein [Paenibacillus filicis]MCZ8514055.1 hypothetical protein [Paenibacillus filicis]
MCTPTTGWSGSSFHRQPFALPAVSSPGNASNSFFPTLQPTLQAAEWGLHPPNAAAGAPRENSPESADQWKPTRQGLRDIFRQKDR